MLLCRQPVSIDTAKVSPKLQSIRTHLIKLCAEAEECLEKHFSKLLVSFHGNPLDHLTSFPYYENYVKLGQLEHHMLVSQLGRRTHHPARHGHDAHLVRPKSVAFIGSGPLPLTSIILAKQHFPNTLFHNYDIDPVANAMALRLVRSDCDLGKRMEFHTADVMDLTGNHLRNHDVLYLAALVGMDSQQKGEILTHLASNMETDALLMLRSAHGARAFLYPVVEAKNVTAAGLEVLSTFHPQDEVINSILIAGKRHDSVPS